MFQVIAPMSPAKMIAGNRSDEIWSSRMIPPEIVFATSVDRKAPTRFRIGGDQHRRLGLERARRDGRRHRVGGVVEAVREVEEQRQYDDQHEGECYGVHRSLSSGGGGRNSADVIGVTNEQFTVG